MKEKRGTRARASGGRAGNRRRATTRPCGMRTPQERCPEEERQETQALHAGSGKSRCGPQRRGPHREHGHTRPEAASKSSSLWCPRPSRGRAGNSSGAEKRASRPPPASEEKERIVVAAQKPRGLLPGAAPRGPPDPLHFGTLPQHASRQQKPLAAVMRGSHPPLRLAGPRLAQGARPASGAAWCPRLAPPSGSRAARALGPGGGPRPLHNRRASARHSAPRGPPPPCIKSKSRHAQERTGAAPVAGSGPRDPRGPQIATRSPACRKRKPRSGAPRRRTAHP